MRYQVFRQKWNEYFRHDDGFAIVDALNSRQVGWSIYREQAKRSAEEYEVNPIDDADALAELPIVKISAEPTPAASPADPAAV